MFFFYFHTLRLAGGLKKRKNGTAFVNTVKTIIRIFKICLSSGSQTILVFPYQTSWQYSDGSPLTGSSDASGVSTNHDSGRIAGY